MGRPRKCRWVEMVPEVTFFKPRGIPLRLLEMTVITVDELEAMRLADHLEMTQNQVAQKMQVSRPTVTRMLARARKAVADALANGKAILIEGGDYRLEQQDFLCGACGHPWTDTEEEASPGVCSRCLEPVKDPEKP